jgi:hypothetical protein
VGGRKQIAADVGLSEQQVWRVIDNFRKNPNSDMNIKANNQFTEISISNWHKYQRKPNNKPNNEVNNEPKTSEQQPNTNKEIKNILLIKNNIIKTSKIKNEHFVEEGSNPLFREWCSTDKRVPFREFVIKMHEDCAK